MKLRRIPIKLEKETWEEQQEAGRHNPGLVVLFRDRKGKHRVPISAGYSDDVEGFRSGEETYILSMNRGLNYVGLQVFQGSDEIGDMFVDRDYDIEEMFGPRGLDTADYNIAKILANYIY